MDGNKKGLLLLGAILIIASGAVLAHGVFEYARENEELMQKSYLEGMKEMHNNMMGTDLSAEEVFKLHGKGGCFGY